MYNCHRSDQLHHLALTFLVLKERDALRARPNKHNQKYNRIVDSGRWRRFALKNKGPNLYCLDTHLPPCVGACFDWLLLAIREIKNSIMKPTYFKFFDGYIDTLRNCDSHKDRSILLMAMFDYWENGTIPSFSKKLQDKWRFLYNSLKQSRTKAYAKLRENAVEVEQDLADYSLDCSRKKQRIVLIIRALIHICVHNLNTICPLKE